jgi:hypothetical protein
MLSGRKKHLPRPNALRGRAGWLEDSDQVDANRRWWVPTTHSVVSYSADSVISMFTTVPLHTAVDGGGAVSDYLGADAHLFSLFISFSVV